MPPSSPLYRALASFVSTPFTPLQKNITAGGYMANKANARRYTAEVIEISMRGTPLRPGRMDMYLFELYDESSKDGAYEEKHFGLFDIEGNPK